MVPKGKTSGGAYCRVAGLMLLLCLVGTSVVLAQMPTATILGVVKDSTGAIVPNATLTTRNI